MKRLLNAALESQSRNHLDLFFSKAAVNTNRALNGTEPPMNKMRGVHMSFYKEPTHYEKNALSELQGVWTILRDTVVVNF